MVLFTHAIHQNSMGQAVDAVELMEDLVVGTGTKKVVLPTTPMGITCIYMYIYSYIHMLLIYPIYNNHFFAICIYTHTLYHGMSKSRSFFHSINSAWYTVSGFNGLPLHPFKKRYPKSEVHCSDRKNKTPHKIFFTWNPTEGDPHR